MKKVQVIGAGQLGSRHLQAVKALREPLQITVVDPSSASLQIARERYEGAPAGSEHLVRYETEIQASREPWDLVIVATGSAVRRQVVEKLLCSGPVRNLVLEKTLFASPDDFAPVSKMISETQTAAYVNCCMRQMPIYRKIKEAVGSESFQFSVTGSQYGLVTNAIHYLDTMAWFAGSTKFDLGTQGLDSKSIPSKRPGYLELNGMLTASFPGRAHGVILCFPNGVLPVVVEVTTPTQRWIVRESERKAWVALERDAWKWNEIEAVLPYQSQMTTELAEELFGKGTCSLTPFAESVEIHKNLLNPLRAFLDQHGIAHRDPYPFT